jgi:hypothetical protein
VGQAGIQRAELGVGQAGKGGPGGLADPGKDPRLPSEPDICAISDPLEMGSGADRIPLPVVGGPSSTASVVAGKGSDDVPAPEQSTEAKAVFSRSSSGVLGMSNLGFLDTDRADQEGGKIPCGVLMEGSQFQGCGDGSSNNLVRPVLVIASGVPSGGLEVEASVRGMSKTGSGETVLEMEVVEPGNVEKLGECSGIIQGAVVCVDDSVPEASETEDGSFTSIVPLAVNLQHKALGGESPAWVLDMVSSVGEMVGLSCGGQEEKMRELFAALERDRAPIRSKTSRKSGGRMIRELKGLKSSVNYEGSSSTARKTVTFGMDC